jgi:hypothetical protein
MNEPLEKGVGWGPEESGPGGWSYEAGVWRWLRMGYPKLALAAARGIPFVPYYVDVRATFDNVDVSNIPEVGSESKIVADTIIDGVIGRVTPDRVPANVFQPQRDFYYGFQSGIEVKVNVVGMPRPSIANRFTPLSNFCDMFNGDARANGGWILTYQQQLQVDFLARIQLADFPTTVIMTFRCFTPDTTKYDGSQLTDSMALEELRSKCGYCVPDCYITACKS